MNKKEILQNNMEKFFGYFNISPNLLLEEEDGALVVSIEGRDLSYLIGFKGQTLESLQNIMSMIMLKETGEFTPMSIDINGYKDQKSEQIQEITKRYIDKVRFFEKEVALPPMRAWERRQVHMFVSDYNDIVSESEGQGNYRRVVLKPAVTK